MSRPYNLSQVQRELDFNGNIVNNIPKNKFNINPNKTPSCLSQQFGINNNQMIISNNLFSPSNTIGSIKSLSFCANNLKSRTAIKYNVMDLKSRPIPPIGFNVEGKFSVNQKIDDNLDYKINLENIIIGKDKRTTLMLRNIPNKYSLQNLVEEINPSFWGKYDYINLPIDYERKLNLGYAFINFVDPMHVVMFYDTYFNKRWSKYRSDKVNFLNNFI
jgi:hypothetical protein